MNINDYKDTNGNVEVSETLVSDIIGGINGVVESGSNSNGNWVKFADGTLIQYMNFVLTSLAMTTATGNVFRSVMLLANYPINFVGTPSVTGFANGGTDENTGFWLNGVTIGANNRLYYRVVSTSSITTDVRLSFIAIGRWK